ncbi:HepT-like ribonuclease domain-containing protein [Microbacterium sp. NPDC055683]
MRAPSILWDASEAAKAVHTFTDGVTKDQFFAELLLRSAVERQLEILGEALVRLRRVDLETAGRIPDLHKIIGMRNVIAHEYGDIDYETVWAVVVKYIGPLVVGLDRLLGEADPL